MPIDLGKEIENEIKKGDQACREWVWKELEKKEEPWPAIKKRKDTRGEACVQAHPILGIEKYLGMADKDNRIAHFPSLKLTNDSFRTKTYCRFDPSLKEDLIILDEKIAQEKELKRVQKILVKFREMTGIQTPCLIVSKHYCKIPNTKAKGLGLSASSSGAVAKALVEAGYPELTNNNRFLNVLARYLSGSGTSSASGGFSVWFSHKGVKSEDCYSMRIDNGKNDVQLVVVPIPATFKTEEAHEDAEASWFYPYWAKHKPQNVLRLMQAIKDNNTAAIGEIAEHDSINLFHLLASKRNVINWEPATLAVLRHVVFNLRKEKGLVAYCSMDTGPSIAIITTKKDAPLVKKEIESFLQSQMNLADYPVYLADLAGAPAKLRLEERNGLLTPTVKQILQEKGIRL